MIYRTERKEGVFLEFYQVILTFLMSLVPVIELRGAIPYGVAAGVPLWLSIIVAIIGNILPAPFIILFIHKIFAFLRKYFKFMDKIVTKLENRANSKSDMVKRYEFWGLVLLVAVPLPGTGAWTGALVAAMMHMDMKKAMPAIAVGVVIAAIVVSIITFGVAQVF